MSSEGGQGCPPSYISGGGSGTGGRGSGTPGPPGGVGLGGPGSGAGGRGSGTPGPPGPPGLGVCVRMVDLYPVLGIGNGGGCAITKKPNLLPTPGVSVSRRAMLLNGALP